MQENRFTQMSGQAVLETVCSFFLKVEDPRKGRVQIQLADALKSAYSMFALKFPSLLKFEEERQKNEKADEISNLMRIFGVKRVPSDTQMREILDPIDPDKLRPIFKKLFSMLQRAKQMEAFEYLRTQKNEPGYLLSIDGTGFFSSNSIHCENCLIKESKTNGTSYYHQILAGSIVHPDLKTVIPFAPEPILKQDGSTKNDCEWNATLRFIDRLKSEHPKLNAVIITDGLITKPKMINFIKGHEYSYILGVKPGDHKGLFEFIEGSDQRGHVRHYEWTEVIGDKVKKTVTHHARYKENVPLSNKDADLLGINFIEYWETIEWEGKRGKQVTKKHFSWVTDLQAKGLKQIQKLIKGGRARWKIENETFNTLKNQGYQFEHNFGHGNKNLSTVFAFLMMLSFCVDQMQQMCCKKFKKLLAKIRRTEIWERMRSAYKTFELQNWDQLLDLLIHKVDGKYLKYPTGIPNTS